MIKNEADIIRPFLEETSQWADRIFVYDNGSTDGTWEIVQSMASEVIVPWKSEDIPFHNDLRSRVFNAFRHESEPGDWWCYRMDPDEFYVDDPREFLTIVPSQFHVVYRKCLNYRVTIEDVDEYPFTGDFSHDRPFLQYFLPEWGIETRFIRYRDKLVWNEDKGTVYKGITYPELIFARHYRWRSPQQIKMRLDSKRDFKLRKAVRKGRAAELPEIEQVYVGDRWRAMCPPRAELIEDTGPESYKMATFPWAKYRRTQESWWSYPLKRTLHAMRLLH